MTQARISGDSRTRRQDILVVGGLLLVGVVLPLVVSVIAGTLEIPRNDDWSYRRIAVDLARTGRFVLDGISETMIIGQILITQPLLWLSGLQPWAFTAASVFFAAAGILSAYFLARCLLPPGLAALAAGLLAIFPGYLAYATSYMSDVPALAAQFLCLAFGAIALRSRPVRLRWLLASAAMGIFAFSIREFAVAAPVSVLLAAICAEPRRARLWGAPFITLACCGGIYLWRSSLPGQLAPIAPGFGSIDQIVRALTTVALVVSPAALIGAIHWRGNLRSTDVLLGLGIGGSLAAGRIFRWWRDGELPPILVENLVSKYGAQGDYITGDQPQILSDPAWVAINLLALGAAIVVLAIGAGIAGQSIRRSGLTIPSIAGHLGTPLGVPVLFCLAVTSGLLLFGLMLPLFDRYYWPLVPPLAATFLYVPRGLARIPSSRSSNLWLAGAAAALATVLATTSLVLLMNGHASSAARWHAGERLVAAGLSADEVDAGYEWMGYYATSAGDPTRRSAARPFYRSWWPLFTECGLVSGSPRSSPEFVLIGTIAYDRYLLAGLTDTLYLYRRGSAECDPG